MPENRNDRIARAYQEDRERERRTRWSPTSKAFRDRMLRPRAGLSASPEEICAEHNSTPKEELASPRPM